MFEDFLPKNKADYLSDTNNSFGIGFWTVCWMTEIWQICHLQDNVLKLYSSIEVFCLDIVGFEW